MNTAIKALALELGFDDCRITSAAPPQTAAALQEWLREGQHGQMAWLERNSAKRGDPSLVLPGAKSIVLVAVSYHLDRSATTEVSGPAGVIARYALHADYHEVMADRLKQLAAFINSLGGEGSRSLWYVDTGPILERDLAQRAGLGFIGKHTNLISRRLGNWFFIGEILTTLELDPDHPERNRCGSCVRCIAACPTAAITAPFSLDARRCISYLTIELKGPIPEDLRPLIGSRIFGCDDCLEVCPWNRFAREGNLMSSHRRRDLDAAGLLELLSLDERGFKARFAGTPIVRTKRRGLLRNVCVALGNVGGAESLPALEQAAGDPEPLIAEHARWAIARISARQ
jgi:epoxyqueuosine reductase